MSSTSEIRDMRLKVIRRHIRRLPGLSTTMAKVVEICNDPSASPNDLNRVVSLDPVLAGQVLQLVNSAYFSLASKVTSLTRAIIMVGINTIKNMALSLSIIGAVKGKTKSAAFSEDQFWDHCIRVAAAAKALAAAMGVDPREHETYFLGGLLHDLGKIPLANCFPDEYDQIVTISAQMPKRIIDAELKVLNVDHGGAGRILADKWQLTPSLTCAIAQHHDPAGAENDLKRFAQIIALADAYAIIISDVPESAKRLYARQIKELLPALDFDLNALAAQKKTIEEELDKAKIFLNI